MAMPIKRHNGKARSYKRLVVSRSATGIGVTDEAFDLTDLNESLEQADREIAEGKVCSFEEVFGKPL
ncbi:MAG: hypothetical protein ACYC56_05570 [Candidatus Aquicultor sp.]